MTAKSIGNGLITLLVKRVVGPFRIRRKWLNKTQWLSAAELEEIQLNLLKRLISHCYDTVPYYRNKMDELGISPQSIRTLEDIKRFPILTKRQAFRSAHQLVSTKYPKWLTRTAQTGGTTGTPLLLRRNLFSIGDEHAFVRRQWDWAGIGSSDRCAYLKARLIGESTPKANRLYVYDPIMRELHLSNYNLSIHTVKTYESIIRRYDIKAIVGYPSAINLFARLCLNSGIKLRFKSALLTAETLTPIVRDIIAKAFDCKVFDFYGAAERVVYIHSCEHERYHIIPEYGLTEMIPVHDTSSKRYKLIATGFWNTAMPLIRYDTEDTVTGLGEPCPCGRAFSTVQSISGREGDVIRTVSGKELGVGIFGYTVYMLCCTNNIVESQIIQDTLDHITIEYVPDTGFSSQNLSEFENRLKQYLPDELSFTLKQVDCVKRTKGGKIKLVVSFLDS